MPFTPLDKGQKRSLSNQIHGPLRRKILRGKLKSGERLPFTREPAKSIHVSETPS
jgi:DNA-binding transcriptional regulator YhcF (GntR family)